MPGMEWTELLNSPQPTGAGTALTNSTTATDISFGAATAGYVLNANFAVPGTALSFVAWGTFGSAASTPGNLTLGIYFGGVAGVALAATAATALPTSGANWPWRLMLDTDVWTTGPTGTANSAGFLLLGSSLTAFSAAIALPGTAQATVTLDTTAAKALTVGATFGTANASNTITCRGFKIFSDGL